MIISFQVNGELHKLEVEPTKTLLQILHDRLFLKSVREGCATGECGACTVIMNGQAVPSCLILTPDVNGSKIMTAEGLARENDPIINAFVTYGAVQCGFCTSGIIMSAKSMLLKNKRPDHEQVLASIEGNLCRCTGYVKIIEAIRSVINHD